MGGLEEIDTFPLFVKAFNEGRDRSLLHHPVEDQGRLMTERPCLHSLRSSSPHSAMLSGLG